MKKLFFIFLLLAFGSSAFARNVWVDNKMMCEKTKGNWQIFNNNCANLCDNKFDPLFCTSIAGFNCNCGNKRCWDGDKCVSDKIGKISWEEKTKDARQQREAELKEIEKKTAILQVAIISQTLAVNNTINSTTAALSPNATTAVTLPQNAAQVELSQPSAPAALPPITLPTPIISPELAQKNAEQKTICEKQSGSWKEFQNGFAGNCGSKIAKSSMCTTALTLGCECGESKCWDSEKNTCVEIEAYKALFSASTLPSIAPQPNIPTTK